MNYEFISSSFCVSLQFYCRLISLFQWLNGGNDHDELIQRSLKHSNVMTYTADEDQHLWDWDIITAILRVRTFILFLT